MSLEREERHLPRLIAICFIANWVLGLIGELSPARSFWQVFLWQWGSLLFITGSTLFAAKLATDKWHISSAGFILLSIGQGIFYTIQDATLGRGVQSAFASGIMLFLPGMVLLGYYSGFPRWLRVLGLAATLPFLVVMVKIDMKTFDTLRDAWYLPTGFFMIEVVGVCWSYYAFRPRGSVSAVLTQVEKEA